MTKKQPMLAAFDFTKTVFHRGGEMKVDLPTSVTLSSANLECLQCEQKFINQQGLSVHIKCKHSIIDGKAIDHIPNTKTELNENENYNQKLNVDVEKVKDDQ